MAQNNPFSPDQWVEFFKVPDMAKAFDITQLTELAKQMTMDPATITRMQQQNLLNWQKSGQESFEHYQRIYVQQLGLIQKAMSLIQENSSTVDAAQAQAKVQECFAMVTDLTKEFQSANAKNFEEATVRVREALDRMKKGTA